MKMELFLKRSRGSVTIMLCIVMLPMILFSAIVVDVSRIMYTKSMIAGAGDLVLNAQMSEFDHVLQDMYGIFASSGSEAELKEALRVYYDQTIRGILPEEDGSQDNIGKIVNELLGIAFDRQSVDSFEFSNMLSLALEDDGNGFSISGVPGSAIANPAVLKRQIIDAMKYRAPISVASSLLTKINAIKNSNAQTKVVEKKVEYTRSMDALSQACMNAAKDIVIYDTLCVWLNDRFNTSFQTDICNKARYYYFGALVAEQYAEKIELETKNRASESDAGALLKNRVNECYKDKAGDMFDCWYQSEEQIDVDYQTKLAEIATSERRYASMEEIDTDLGYMFSVLECIVDYDSNQTQGVLESCLAWNIDLKKNNDNNRTMDDGTIPGLSQLGYEEIKDLLSVHKQLETSSCYDFPMEKTGTINLKDQWKLWVEFVESQSNVLNGSQKVMSREAISLIDKFAEANKKIDVLLKYYQLALEAQENEEKGTDGDKPVSEKLAGLRNKYNEWVEKKKDYDFVNEYLSGKDNLINVNGIKGELKAFESNICNAKTAENIVAIFLGKASETLNDYYGVAKLISLSADEICNDMNTIITCLEEIKQKKKEWEDSIKKVDDGVTKSTFESDYQTTTEAFNEDDIRNLADEVKKGVKKAPYAKQVASIVEETKFLGKKTVDTTIKLATFTQMDAVTLFKKATKVSLQNLISGKNGIGRTELKNALSMKKYDSEQFFSVANMKLHDGGKAYSFSKKLYVDGKSGISPKASDDTVFYCLGTVELNLSLDELGYIDGFIDNPQYNESNNKAQDLSVSDFLKGVEKVSEEVYDKERFALVLFDYITQQNAKEKTEDQKNDEKALNDQIANDETLKEEKKDDSEDKDDSGEDKATTSIGTILLKIKLYQGVHETSSGDSMDPGDTSNMKGTKVPEKGKSSYSDEGGKASGSLASGGSFFDKLADIGKVLVQNVYLEEYFTEMFSCNMDVSDKYKSVVSKNLLGEEFNSKTEWYGKEIEYLLWGNSNFDANVSSTYGTIFVIRLALNCVYAFTASDIRAFSRSLAMAIAGVFPFAVPLVQAVIIIALALAESGIDIDQLRKGNDVVIYKSARTFVCSPNGLANTLTQKLSETVAEVSGRVVENCSSFIRDMGGKIGEHLEDLNGYIDKSIDSQTESMREQVIDFIITPIQNSLDGLVDRMHLREKINDEDIRNAVDYALNIAEEQAEKQSASMMKDLEKEALRLIRANKWDENIKNKLITIKNQNAKSMISSEEIVSVLKTELKDKLNGVNTFTTAIKEYKNSFVKEAQDGLKSLEDKGIDAFESYMDDITNKATDKISGRVSEYAKAWTEQNGGVSTPTGGTNLTLNYKEYCKIFVLIGVSMDDTTMLQRAAALIQANVKAGNGKKSNPEFDVTKACTLFRVTANVQMKTLLPWGVKTSTGDSVESTGWSISAEDIGSYDATVIYTGVAGY